MTDIENIEEELTSLLNRHCVDTELNMHDFVIAAYIIEILKALKVANKQERKLSK